MNDPDGLIEKEIARLIGPHTEPEPEVPVATMLLGTNWRIVVFPDSAQHRRLALKLCGSKNGQLVPLSNDELALLAEFILWPQPTVSY